MMFKSLRKSIKRSIRHSLGLPTHAAKKALYGNDALDDIVRLASALGRKIDIVFDVGAYHGATSTFFVLNFPKAKVFAFEPHGPSLDMLRKNVVNEAFQSFELALSDKIGQAEFHEYGNQSTINSLESHAPYAVRFDRKSKSRVVNIDTVDAFCVANNIDHISVLKIDTEGHDLSVMKGATGLFERRKIDFVFFEFTNFGASVGAQGGALNEIGTFLDHYDFQFVATYTDYIVPKKDIFVVANGLAVRK